MNEKPSKKVTIDLFEPIHSESIPETVAKQIEDLILNGILREGARLPAERELANKLEISRQKVREALDILRSRELISSERTETAVIARLTKDAMSPALIDLFLRRPEAIYDHLEFRRVQECFAARLAALRATDEDKQALKDIIAEMIKAHEDQDDDLEAELDTQFHAAVVDASHNRHLIHTMTSLYEMNQKGLKLNRKNVSNLRETASKFLQQHRAICEAICADQPEEAAAAAELHIDYVRWSITDAEANRERRLNAQKRILARQVFVPSSTMKKDS